MIKPIQTYYNGYHFRSRLEARWAVFFDALGVSYEYEPEGFWLPNGQMYLPDFRVKCWGERGNLFNEPFDLWIEVKGELSFDDAERIVEFSGLRFEREETFIDGEQFWGESAFLVDNPVLIVGNIPSRGHSYDSAELKAYIQPQKNWSTSHACMFNYMLIDGDYYAAYPAAYKGKFFLWGDDSNYIWNVDEVERAYDKARQARFEHGETP